MTPFSQIQAAAIAAVTQILAMLVGFGVLNAPRAAVVLNAAVALLGLGFMIANAIHAHSKPPPPPPPVKP